MRSILLENGLLAIFERREPDLVVIGIVEAHDRDLVAVVVVVLEELLRSHVGLLEGPLQSLAGEGLSREVTVDRELHVEREWHVDLRLGFVVGEGLARRVEKNRTDVVRLPVLVVRPARAQAVFRDARDRDGVRLVPAEDVIREIVLADVEADVPADLLSAPLVPVVADEREELAELWPASLPQSPQLRAHSGFFGHSGLSARLATIAAKSPHHATLS
jgi:hypothetical protein